MLLAAQEPLHLTIVPDPEPTVELVDVTKCYGRRRRRVTALDGVSTSFFGGL
jgi:hypothetical protein